MGFRTASLATGFRTVPVAAGFKMEHLATGFGTEPVAIGFRMAFLATGFRTVYPWPLDLERHPAWVTA